MICLSAEFCARQQTLVATTISIYKVSKHSRCSKQVLDVRTNVPALYMLFAVPVALLLAPIENDS